MTNPRDLDWYCKNYSGRDLALKAGGNLACQRSNREGRLIMDTYQAGDICTYSFGNKNRSVAIVEIVRLLDDPRGAAEVRFLDVIIDDTGNGFFFTC